MTPMPARLGHDVRILFATLAAGAPAVAVALTLLWTGEHALRVEITLTLVILGFWIGLSASVRAQVLRPLQVIANLLASVREGDFSVRARAEPGHGQILGAALAEINAVGETVREQRLGALEASTLLTKVMLEIDVAIFAFDADGRLRLCNRAGERLLGRPPGQLMGEGAGALGMAAFLTGEAPRTVELGLPGGQGQWELRRTSFRQHGRPHELVVLSNLQRALRAEERLAWQRLVRVLGHEINNSLAPISSIAGSLRQSLHKQPRPPAWDADVDRALDVVERRAEGLSRFMTAYARLARLPPPRPAPLDASAWVRRIAALDARLPVQVIAGPALTVTGDADQLDQLLINLVRNAIDAASETGGAVEVTWQRSGTTLEVRVRDGGPGIATASGLFVPFFTTKPHGSGIGLVLSRQIAEAHHGSLELHDRGSPPGCDAVLRLPL
jgi:nitrogen fixation/metabolism regulation signal transduction histidine kinase